jgi:hypothetical protein
MKRITRTPTRGRKTVRVSGWSTKFMSVPL